MSIGPNSDGAIFGYTGWENIPEKFSPPFCFLGDVMKNMKGLVQSVSLINMSPKHMTQNFPTILPEKMPGIYNSKGR